MFNFIYISHTDKFQNKMQTFLNLNKLVTFPTFFSSNTLVYNKIHLVLKNFESTNKYLSKGNVVYYARNT